MHTSVRIVALVAFALPACAVAQTAHEVSRIGGSIYPTVVRPAPPRAPAPTAYAHPRVAPSSINAVCIASQAHADRCQGQANMAFCDVDTVGLSRCLSHYASALVTHPASAKRTWRVVVQDAQGTLRNVTVLATSVQSDKAVAKAALDGAPGAAVVAMRSP